MTAGRAALPAALIGTTFRPARPDDLPVCAEIWRDALNDYLQPLNQEAVPDELGPIGRLYAHTRATDPDRFVVAAVPGAGGLERHRRFRVGRACAAPIWFLSMLFVRPEAQGQGLGSGAPRAAAARGPTIVDRWRRPSTASSRSRPRCTPATGSPRGCRSSTCAATSADRRRSRRSRPGIVPVPFSTIDDGPADDRARIELAAARDALDRELLGAEHPEDHRFLRTEGRQGFLYRGPDGSPLGYGYAGEVGRIGPIALRDETLLESVVGHLAGCRAGARRSRRVGDRRRATPRFDPPGGRVADRRLPAPAVLGPSVRRSVALPADLPGPALTVPDPASVVASP